MSEFKLVVPSLTTMYRLCRSRKRSFVGLGIDIFILRHQVKDREVVEIRLPKYDHVLLLLMGVTGQYICYIAMT